MTAIADQTTLILLAYRQEDYVVQAVEAALAQDWPNLEILLSDDCSPDATYARMKEVVSSYRGPHEVRLLRNEVNLGITAHLAKVIVQARGAVIVLSAGDDVSRSDRVSRLMRTWTSAGCPPSVLYSDYLPMASNGTLLAWEQTGIFQGPHRIEAMADGVVQVLGATSAITADLVTDFPPLLPAAVYEDRIFPFRALMKGGAILFVDEPLVSYRLNVGISQARADDEKNYLNAFSRRLETQKLADAVQRLYDLVYTDLSKQALRRRCERAIANHETRLAFANAKWNYERVFVNSLSSGGSMRVAMRLYLKHRFFPISRYFMKI